MPSENGHFQGLKSNPTPGPRLRVFWLVPTVIGLAVWLIFRTPGYDLSRVDAELRKHGEAAQAIKVECLGEGSITLQILGPDWEIFTVGLPLVTFGGKDPNYPSLRLGGGDASPTETLTVPCSGDTKRYIASLMDRFDSGSESEPALAYEKARCLFYLRGSAWDKLKLWWRKRQAWPSSS